MKKLNMRNLLVNKKLTRLLLMMIMVPMVMATSCKKPNTCDYEKDNLDDAQAEETRLNNEFTVNADSCIHYYGEQMPAGFSTAAYNNLQNVGTAPYTKRDSVTVLTYAANDVLPVVPETDSKYPVLKGISRTGGNALTAWDAYLNAQIATQNAQTAYMDCQNGN